MAIKPSGPTQGVALHRIGHTPRSTGSGYAPPPLVSDKEGLSLAFCAFSDGHEDYQNGAADWFRAGTGNGTADTRARSEMSQKVAASFRNDGGPYWRLVHRPNEPMTVGSSQIEPCSGQNSETVWSLVATLARAGRFRRRPPRPQPRWARAPQHPVWPPEGAVALAARS
mgnify:CR=1 FL=1